MTTKSEDVNKNIRLVGFSNVKIQKIDTMLEQFRNQNKEAPIQFFDAKNVAGKQHMYFAALNALNAFNKKTNISNNLAVEALLYASGQRQIKKAVNMLGIKQDTTEAIALIIAKNSQEKDKYTQLATKTIPGKRDDKVIELTDKKIVAIKKLFKISDKEFKAKLEKEGKEKEALTDLVIEHMALLVTRN
jgi:KEOPS complex subunit Cgi121